MLETIEMTAVGKWKHNDSQYRHDDLTSNLQEAVIR